MDSQASNQMEEHLDIFYLAFGILRQSIWIAAPRMKQHMLTSYT